MLFQSLIPLTRMPWRLLPTPPIDTTFGRQSLSLPLCLVLELDLIYIA